MGFSKLQECNYKGFNDMNYDEFKVGPWATGDNDAIVDDFTWNKYFTKSGTIVITAADNDVIVQVVASSIKEGEDFPIIVQAETTITPASHPHIEIPFNTYYPRMRVIARSAMAGQSGNVTIEGSAIAV